MENNNKLTFRRSSSTTLKEPILHQALISEAQRAHHTSQPVSFKGIPINSNSSSSTSSSDSTCVTSSTLHKNIISKLKDDQDGCTVKDSENDVTLFNTLSDTQGLKSVRSHMELAKTAHSVRALAKRSNRATIHLNVNNVMIITKARDNSLVYLTNEMTEWLLTEFQHLVVFVDTKLSHSARFNAPAIASAVPNGELRLRYWDKNMIKNNDIPFDFVITLGGDGTVLHASTLFQNVVPPILSFSLGSLGFLTCFAYENFRDVSKNAIEKGVNTDSRMRFTCRVHNSKGDLVCEQQVLNESTVDRGPSPYVTMLELYGDDKLLTVAQADGLIIATPTGSTAYSLSAGGSLVHPEVSCICVTPICPHTLSFRPIMLPDSIKSMIKVPLRSRSTAWAAFDGRNRVKVDIGGYVTICASRYPFPTVKNSSVEYFESVSRILNWNSRKEQKNFKHLLNDKNKKLCDLQGDETTNDDLHSIEDQWDIDYSDIEEED